MTNEQDKINMEVLSSSEKIYLKERMDKSQQALTYFKKRIEEELEKSNALRKNYELEVIIHRNLVDGIKDLLKISDEKVISLDYIFSVSTIKSGFFYVMLSDRSTRISFIKSIFDHISKKGDSTTSRELNLIFGYPIQGLIRTLKHFDAIFKVDSRLTKYPNSSNIVSYIELQPGIKLGF